MARPTQQASVSDDKVDQLNNDSQSSQGADEDTPNPQPSQHQAEEPQTINNTFKSRKSVLDSNDDKPTFWNINSFNETAAWSDSQQVDAIKQAHRLATHYVTLHDERTNMLTTIQSLQARIETLNNDNHNLQADNDDLERELTKKQGTIEYLEQQRRQPSATLSADDTPNTHSTKGRARLEDPEKFSGKKDDQVEFETWKSNIESKLKIDSRLFDDENHKIFYVYSRTTSDAQGHIRDQVDNNIFKTAKDVVKALEAVYSDPHKAIKAEAELQRLGQTLHGSFHLFYTDFLRIVRPLGYNDNKLKETLISKLNDKYLTSIGAYFELPYTQLIEKLHAIDKRYESQRIARESRKQLNTSQLITSNSKPLDKTTKGQTPALASTTTTTPRTIADKTPIRSRAEFEALHQAGLCKKCCKPTHTAPNERCQEKTWSTTPANIKALVLKQVNNIEAEPEASDQPKN